MNIRHILTVVAIMAASVWAPAIQAFTTQAYNLKINEITPERQRQNLNIAARVVLDSVSLGSNRIIYVTPVVMGPDGQSEQLAPMMINGRNVYYAYQRGSLPKGTLKDNTAYIEMRRNGSAQDIGYSQSTPLAQWMFYPSAGVRFVIDEYDLRHNHAHTQTLTAVTPLGLMPDFQMAYAVPDEQSEPVRVTEGNAADLDKAVSQALANPVIEITGVNICGNGSPDGAYERNKQQATARARAAADQLRTKFNLPSSVVTYSVVPENWAGFRQQVVQANDITENQRAALLKLIDAPAYGAVDYDDKESSLRTDKTVGNLYRTKILPQWFPTLRDTRYTLSTALRPMTDREMADLLKTQPDVLSQGQMMRVAGLYPEGSADFNRVIDTALRCYPDSEAANLNAAVCALNSGDDAKAARLLSKAGELPQAWNARGILAARRGDFKQAKADFERAGTLPQAMRNLQLINR